MLSALLAKSDRCGDRLSLERATIAPSAPAAHEHRNLNSNNSGMLLSDGGRAECDTCLLRHLEPHSVIADAEPQIAAAFQLLDLAYAARRVIGESAGYREPVRDQSAATAV